MGKRAIIPKAFRQAAEAARMSPGIVSGGHVFLTGVTGSGADGAMPESYVAQFEAAFEKIRLVLAEAGCGLDDVVEMTSYHVGLREHFEVFDKVRRALFCEPYPAWTAVEAGGLRRVGAVVEIRVIAAL